MTDREKAVNELRMLSAMEIAKAKSGHTGIALSSAPIMFALFNDHLNFNVKDTNWLMRDRFVMSAGHGSALLYAILHMFGFDYSIKDLQNFRQINSKCAGHPETISPYIEASTGPLGQGIANAVGMALCEKKLNDLSKKENEGFFSHYTYVLAGEGDISEGICYEACSLAGLWKLNKLIILLDNNNMTIEGKAELALSEDLIKRFEAQGFFVQVVENGNDSQEISNAIAKAKEQNEKPSLIICKTKLGYGCELEDTPQIHGKALDEKGLKYLSDKLGVNVDNWKFSKSTKAIVNESLKKKKELYNKTQKRLQIFMQNKLFQPLNIDKIKESLFNQNWFYDLATRESSGKILNFLKEQIPNLIGGSADLAPSTKSYFLNEDYFSSENIQGRNIHFGIREHAMAGIANGIQLYGVYRAFVSTFFVFSDYLKPSLRMSALMKLNVLYLFTHDSILVGEDGPTHQPIEQLANLRNTPNVLVFRPCDTRETVAGYLLYLLNDNKPTALILSRQTLNMQNSDLEKAVFGGYILEETSLNKYDVTLIASGSEVQTCMELRNLLFKKGYIARVVSMPCESIFNEQTQKYKRKVLGDGLRIFIELSNDNVYQKYLREYDEVYNLNDFGKSGKADDVLDYMSMSSTKLLNKVIKAIKTYKKYNRTLLDD